MTVEELIEELQRQPNQRVPVWFKGCTRIGYEGVGEEVAVSDEVSDVRFDGNRVVLEGE